MKKILIHYVQNTPVNFYCSYNNKAKRLILKFDPTNNAFRVTMPCRTPLRQAYHFLESSHDWILKQMKTINSRISLENNTVIPILGKKYKILHLDSGSSLDISFQKNTLVACAPQQKLNLAIISFLKSYAKTEFQEYCLIYSSILGKNIGKITIRDTRSRWGSCSQKGNISISWRLLFAPKFVSEYVCAHEVAHLSEMNHGPDFWKLVKKLHPEYKTSELWLKKNGKNLFLYGKP